MIRLIIELIFPYNHNQSQFRLKSKPGWYAHDGHHRTILYSANGGRSYRPIMKATNPRWKSYHEYMRPCAASVLKFDSASESLSNATKHLNSYQAVLDFHREQEKLITEANIMRTRMNKEFENRIKRNLK